MTDAAEALPAEPAENKTNNKTTLEAQGPRLPLGTVAGEGLSKELAVRPWRMKEERELGALRDANQNANMAEYVSMVLSAMCTKIGSHELDDPKMKPEQKRLAIGQMFTPDVFYAYVYLRTQALGPELALNVTCPRCAQKVPKFVADLSSVEVTTADTLGEACWEYHLLNPITVRGKKVGTFVLGPTRWNALEMMKGAGIGMAKPAMIKASIHAVGSKEDGEQVVLTETDLDELTKRDIEAMTSQIDNHSLGPNMAVEGKCPSCSFDFKLPIDWGYDSFFGDSSQ